MRRFEGVRVKNERKALTYHRIVTDFIYLSDRIDELVGNTVGPYKISAAAAEEIRRLDQERMRLIHKIKKKFDA